ncbi:protein of unknown function [Shimia gijangensis]|uniref:DUF4336 domain-containing protein n=1 Tax=Shimia gijangensis TaxID=1470563 RepID=A0A1M6DCW1_9RHOB|nr:DUF4336 domain-containing protein [Shimia gijangensis]SHI70838.1 protein of unknown function [Shimia gijangensis]
MTTGYEPLNTLKPIGPDIWIVDGPAIRFYGMPFSTRMTVVRLANGDIWLHSPTVFDRALADQIQALGPVRHLIAPNWIHYAHIADWQAAFPDTVAWAAPGVEERAETRKIEMQIDYDLKLDKSEKPWRAEIKQMVVQGSRIHHEAVFFHVASRTLILTDLIENFERENLPWWMRLFAGPARIMDPDGQMPRDMRMTFRGNMPKLRAAVERMIGWQPERIILAHGRWYNTDAEAELRRAFRFVLK